MRFWRQAPKWSGSSRSILFRNNLLGQIDTGKRLLMINTANSPRVMMAALKGGAGKTLITVGILAALKKRGLKLASFKKGPDYIDAGWLGLASGNPCHNLDKYLFSADIVRWSFLSRSRDKDAAVVEGNRGLFDGVDASGSYSTADLAHVLRCPVILIVDVTKMTRTAAALVLGCQIMDPALDLRGVILNRVAGARHERILRNSIEEACSVPVIGSIAKLSLESFPQRHLGLLPLHEHPAAVGFVQEACSIAERFIDMGRLMEIAWSSGDFGETVEGLGLGRSNVGSSPKEVRIGIVRDSAFQFYYPENFEALESRGAQLEFVSALEAHALPDIDCLYIGGGFPETHATKLAENRIFRKSLLEAVSRGMPVYAECGGLMYLARSIQIDEKVFPMAGVFPIDAVLKRNPQGLGYIRVKVTGYNPFYPKGAVVTGHEFHYSSVSETETAAYGYAFNILRGWGIDGSRDGICTRNVLGTYMHVHALGEPLWADGMVRSAAAYRGRKSRIHPCDDSLGEERGRSETEPAGGVPIGNRQDPNWLIRGE